MVMSFPFFLPPPSGLILRGLNALLAREPWARDRLAHYAGKSLRVAVGDTWHLQASIGSEGYLQPVDTAIVPDVTLAVPADHVHRIPAAWREHGMAGVVDLTRIQGDAGLAHLVSDLAHHLRWDVEDDLARVVGDVLAVRLVRSGRGLAAGVRQAADRLQANLGEYLGDESGVGVREASLQAWSARGQALRGRLDALELRVRQLERAC